MTAYIERIVTEVVVQPEREQGKQETDMRYLEQQKIEAAIKRQFSKSQRTKAEGLDD
ncbi:MULTISPECIES: hypothetical protein [Alteromonadaceae]|uniref:hypothetical protein n=1 Tax=Alteromonadaceae TaxID=72275 RepID=UPI001C0A06ED|nr:MULTISPECIES: hypothetical protein [Aliiglaciecola]MBU2876698.1 hypothetical protein [Aliiglaciecola lipolytica]MDO6710290.1 hypothetical protein [Aliiglaciecola sp. 2_MG-2023]MDO6751438.1 hypothetical protein [Aliiglaciecola sp. 1_MG-2023]